MISPDGRQKISAEIYPEPCCGPITAVDFAKIMHDIVKIKSILATFSLKNFPDWGHTAVFCGNIVVDLL